MNELTNLESITYKLNTLLVEAGIPSLDPSVAAKFDVYLSLILRWNARINLTSIRDPQIIISRHFVESIAVAKALPAGISTLLDYGSGAGLPGIPIALCRPEIAVTLAESKAKKAAFLLEAVRALALPTKVHTGRAEDLPIKFDCVTLRAVDRMPQAVQAAAKLIRPGGWLALMTTDAELPALQSAAGAAFTWPPPTPLHGATARVIALTSKLPLI